MFPFQPNKIEYILILEVPMSSYLSVTGVITQIQPVNTNSSSELGCTMTMAVQTYYQGNVIFTLNGDTYVVDNAPLSVSDPVTVFYDGDAPAPLIYPPQYKAVVAARSSRSQYYLGEFYNNLLSTDRTIQLNGDVPLKLYLPNGQPFYGAITGKTVLVEYTSATKSIPAFVTPTRIIVFCYT